MARPLTPATQHDVAAIQSAIAHLKLARRLLSEAGAFTAAKRVRAAITSAEGAERHGFRRLAETPQA